MITGSQWGLLQKRGMGPLAKHPGLVGGSGDMGQPGSSAAIMSPHQPGQGMRGCGIWQDDQNGASKCFIY